MGIYDRDYYQDERPGIHLGGDRMMVTNLVLANAGLFLLDMFSEGRLSEVLGLRSDLASHPLHAYQLLSYGFLHDTHNLMHIVFNMFGLWFFGRDIEVRYGRKEFVWFYLGTIVGAGFVWLITENMAHPEQRGLLIGASGGVTGVMLLYALNFPRRTLLIWGILPMPAWALAILWLLGDISGAVGRAGNVAYTAHLAGAACGLLYFFTGWSLARFIPSGGLWKRPRARPKLRVHDPDPRENSMGDQVDEVLRKIQEKGQDSLTARERRILEDASRRYQNRRR